jgi:hypothetical protein
MADNTLALQVQPTQFGQNVSQGYSTGLAQIGEQQRQEAAAFEQFAAIGLGVMDGNPDGEIDPAKLDQALGLMGNSPIAAKLKENPELLRTITKGSMNVLQFVRDGEKFEMAKKQFEQELAAAQDKANAPVEVSPGATMWDPATNKPVFTAPTADTNKPMAINDQLIDPATGKVIGDFRDPKGPVEVSPGATMWDPSTSEPVYTAPTTADKGTPEIITIYDENGQERKGYMGPVNAEHPDGFYPVGGSKGKDPGDAFGNEKDLFQQYSASDPVKTYEIVKTSYERVRESAAQQSGAGDLGLIYGYMRMLDPGSVVRESEFAMAAQAGDYGEQIQGLVSRILTGERLPESQRQEFVRSADALYQQTAGNLADINAQFTERATAAGVDPTRFIREPEAYKPLDEAADGERTTPNGITYRVGK